MSDNIPLGIQKNILQRLPVKTLLQLRSVNKSFKALIDEPGFIVSYGVKQPEPCLLLFRRLSAVGRIYTSLVYADDRSYLIQDFPFPIPSLIRGLDRLDKSDLTVVGFSSGLLCLRDLCRIYFWNPSLGKSYGIQYEESYRLIGFGVCPGSLDPIVIGMRPGSVPFLSDSALGTSGWRFLSGNYKPWKVDIFALSTGSWMPLADNLPSCSLVMQDRQVVIDRFIYWAAYDHRRTRKDPKEPKSYDVILSYDLIDKRFEEIMFTALYDSLSEIHGSLVLMERNWENTFLPLYNLWMMDGNKSFTKMWTIDPSICPLQRVAGSWKTDEVIIQKQSDFLIYGLRSEENKRLCVNYDDFVWPHIESLLLLDKSDGYIAEPESKKKAAGTEKKVPEMVADDIDNEFSYTLLKIQVGLVHKASKHPSDDGLLVEEIDVGEGKCRQVVSGLAKFCSLDELTNRLVALITNVKPGKLGDVVSEGLVLCASNADHTAVQPLIVPEGAKLGECVTFSGHLGPEARLNPKKQLDKMTPNLFTDDRGVATFNGIPLMTSAGPCTSTIPNGSVK